MTDKQNRHVFISYVRENQKQVDRLCQDLEKHGVNVWLDRNSIKPGARWKDAIRQAIRHGDFFISCFSDEYTSKTKTYMNEELTLATEELRQYASNREWFIPVLLSECDVPARSIGAGETLLDINWVPLHEDWDAGIQRILSVIKPIPPEIQNLTSALRSEDSVVRSMAQIALVEFGPESVPALVETLKDKNIYTDGREDAADALGDIGPKAKAAVPVLFETLKDKNEDKAIRDRATYALRKIGLEAVPVLIKALKGPDSDVRWNAAYALVDIAPEAKAAAVLALIEVLKDERKWIRENAEWILENINTPEAQKTLEEYKKKSK